MINVPGVGSGLDIASLISQLVAAEGDAKTAVLARKRNDVQAEISAYGLLKNVLSKFQTSVAKLSDTATFESSKLTSSSPEVFTITGSSGATTGNYDIEILTTAESHKLMSTGFADSSTDVGTGDLTIFTGDDSFSVTIDTSNQTLAGIRDAINNAEDNTGVSATIVNVDDGMGGTEAKLILSADGTGTAGEITVIVDDDDLSDTDASGLSVLYYDTDDATSPEQLVQINAAVDASIEIDGQPVTSSSDTIVDAIEGITINLQKADPGNIHTLTVSLDKNSVRNSISTFISNYNDLVKDLNQLTLYDAESGAQGRLLGDQTTLTLINQLRRELNNTVSGISGSVDNLVDLGITTQSDGTLSIDTTKLDSVLDSDFDSVVELFTVEDGIATRFDALLEDYVKTEGILDSKTDSLNSTIKRIDNDFTALNLRLEKYEERLLNQFTALDGLLAQLQSTSDFLTSQLSAISKISVKDSK